MIKNKLLVLFTTSYPYGLVEETFLDAEIPHLSSKFEKIIIVPRKLLDPMDTKKRDLPSNIEVNSSLAQELNHMEKKTKKIVSLLKVFAAKDIYLEIIKYPRILFNISALKGLIFYFITAHKIKKWGSNFFRSNNLDLQRTIFYTYWLSFTTSGLSLLKKECPSMKLISRAHGIDLYYERHVPPYLPHRSVLMNSLDRLFFISEHGKEYLSNKFPLRVKKFNVCRLGVRDPGFCTLASPDNIFRIVSCSYIVPVKRLELLIDALNELGQLKLNNLFEWTHIGSGPAEPAIKKLAYSSLPKNIMCNFIGQLQNEEVISYYKTNYVDVFINVSSSEGIPVSIMEAQSCGIPVIATSVGGTPEIVSDEVGARISENPSPEEIVTAICNIMDKYDDFLEKRENSRINWATNYNSDLNFSKFTDELINL